MRKAWKLRITSGHWCSNQLINQLINYMCKNPEIFEICNYTKKNVPVDDPAVTKLHPQTLEVTIHHFQRVTDNHHHPKKVTFSQNCQVCLFFVWQLASLASSGDRKGGAGLRWFGDRFLFVFFRCSGCAISFDRWWFFSTHLKNMRKSNWVISPGFGVKKSQTYLKNTT